MATERGMPLGGQVLTLSDTTDEAHTIPYATWNGIRKVGIIADADVYIDMDTSTTPRADLATTGLLVVGDAGEAVFPIRFAEGRSTVLHIAAATTAGVHLNWYQ